MRILMALLLLVVAAQAGARELTSGGHIYLQTCNSAGFVLTSKHPVSRTVGNIGALQRQVVGIENIYLGKSCDAYHKLYGYGDWCWANGGFVAEFTEGRFGFARQELWCPENDQIGLNCLC